ncbi:AraC family transcriptional regulator [Pedobacter chinensis]|uniref:AraC family transcriptional regulator n=1 Tax=Pedobacter chinensis TaxID=2282421 RepID=A0A369Q5Q6_9SPHI|nr:AraC family transcriptional regulator [Pedobacter chinensis]RDC58259.1 AraC family transcriptional regulator [Pedobacter chinensis]
MDSDLIYQNIKPDKSLSDFVESFWFLHNQSDRNKETIGLPDGRIDLSLFKSSTVPFRIRLLGVGTQQYEQGTIPANSLIFSVSFKLLAVEYIFHETISDIVNNGKLLPTDFWDFSADDLEDFDAFCDKASQKIQSLLPKEIDQRKQKLFELIYATNGAITIKQLSDNVGWSSRQINRYFNQQFGISLKVYCNIIRFRASLAHIAQGKLFPEENFFDQTHFIKEIKKFSGVVPKELFKNKNDRFILLSALTST